MLPVNHHPHDASWLTRQLVRLPSHLRKTATTGYEKAWSEAWHAEPTPHKRENKARFAANTRLRKYVERVTSARA